MLLDIRRVKLLNFGEAKVRGQLMRNAILDANRHQPMLRTSDWRVLTPHCDRLITHLRAVIRDWGTHLSSQLYNEALVHHFGGEAHCLLRLNVHSDGTHLGTHPVQMHGPNHAFTVTAFTRNTSRPCSITPTSKPFNGSTSTTPESRSRRLREMAKEWGQGNES